MSKSPLIRFHKEDLPDLKDYQVEKIAIDTETLGLNLQRDRLCLIQLSRGDGSADIVQIKPSQKEAPNIVALLENPNILKLFHYGRFDIAVLMRHFECNIQSIFCTKIASKLVRTYTDRHGLKNLCSEFLDIHLSKQQQSSDWGADTLSVAQLEYAAMDVLYLHQLHQILEQHLLREGREDLAKACFKFLPIRAKLDLAGWQELDIFAHN